VWRQQAVNLDDDQHHLERHGDNDYRTVVDFTVDVAHPKHSQPAPDRSVHPASGIAPAAVHNAPESGISVLTVYGDEILLLGGVFGLRRQ
jgi:hypothetical protein